MRVSIIREDNVVIVNGEARHFDLTDIIDPAIHAIQWNNGEGHIEYVAIDKSNTEFSAEIVVKEAIAAWEANAPPPPVYVPDYEGPRRVLKSTIIARLIHTGLIEAAKAALDSNAAAYARWWAPDQAMVHYNAPDAVALLQAIGADVDYVMGPGNEV